MGFDSSWVQEAHNQRVLLDTPERVLIGASRAHVRADPAYPHIEPGELDSAVWDRPVQHTRSYH